MKKHSILKRNGLSIVLITLMLLFLFGQFLMGFKVHNNDLTQLGYPEITMSDYLVSGHFIQATFENWESEFLQMALYVLLTVKLYQFGSAESKPLDKEAEVDKQPQARPDSPWPVKKGGLWLKLYSHSLSVAFVVLFLFSFLMHFYGSLRNYNQEQMMQKLPLVQWSDYIFSSQFWFESFQNWQSEFLAVASVVILSIWLREKGSPESKPVDAPHSETGS